MFQKLSFALSVLMLVLALQSCSSGGDTVQTPASGPKQDTTKTPTPNTHFTSLTANIRWGATGYPAIVTFWIDSAGRTLSFLPGDTVWYFSYGQRHEVPCYDTVADALLQDIEDSGVYEFHFKRTAAKDTFSTVFNIPAFPFHISAPANGAYVTRFNHMNDTIVYQPAGGTEVWCFMSDRNSSQTQVVQNPEPDNGKYGFAVDGYSDGYVELLRHFVGKLSSPAGFKDVNYDYWEKSHSLHLHF